MHIIIPSAKIVSEELQSIGKLPAILYPVNDGISFDYIYKEYKDVADNISIVCYEKAEMIHIRLDKYNFGIVNFIDLPKLDDLGYTIWYALLGKKEPVIINFADTIVFDKIFNEEGDAFFCQEDYLADTWTYFDECNGKISYIYDKERVFSNEKKRLFIGVFKIMNTEYLIKCLEYSFSNRDTRISSFYQALQLYSESFPMQAISTNNWFDLGHASKYFYSNLEVKSREFNHITIDRERGILKKTSDDVDKFIGEIIWYLKLPADIEYVRPRIFDYSTSYNNPYINMEYYAYHTLHELYLYGDLDYYKWVNIFMRIRFVYNDFGRYTVKDSNIVPALNEMYLKKTIQRLSRLKNDVRFSCFFSKEIFVNGVRYKSLDNITEILKEIIPEMLFNINIFTIIHGDLCFSNMMIDNNLSFIKVIDPRGKFGIYDIYGDPRYELAKLLHSIDGKYDYIIKDLFTIKYDLNSAVIEYHINDCNRSFSLSQVFLEVFKDEIDDRIREIELIESLLFLSMIPLHMESVSHQVALLATGLDILNRVIDISL